MIHIGVETFIRLSFNFAYSIYIICTIMDTVCFAMSGRMWCVTILFKKKKQKKTKSFTLTFEIDSTVLLKFSLDYHTALKSTCAALAVYYAIFI